MRPEAVNFNPVDPVAREASNWAELDLVKLYMDQASKVPLLNKQQEVDLGHAVQAGLSAARELAGEARMALADERVAELEALQQAGQAAAKTFAEANLRLVVSVAKRYQSRGLELPDLIQEGNFGLLHAVKKFDPKRGFKFSTSATWWIRQAIGRGLDNRANAIRLPAEAGDTLRELRRRKEELKLEFGCSPTLAELAAALGMNEDRVGDLLAADRANAMVSLDAPLGFDADSPTLADVVADPGSRASYEKADHVLLLADIGRLLVSCLSADKADGTGSDPCAVKAIRLCYGLDGGEPLSFKQIGEELGITANRVGQIVRKALAALEQNPRIQAAAKEEGLVAQPKPKPKPEPKPRPKPAPKSKPPVRLTRHRLRQTSGNSSIL